jgi:hypothetical protein
MLSHTVVHDFSAVEAGTSIKTYANPHTGLPLAAHQSVVLHDVKFLPPADGRPSLLGVLVRAGPTRRRSTGVVLNAANGALAVRLDDTWTLGWLVSGWHPGKQSWRVINQGELRFIYEAEWVAGVGPHLFVLPPRERSRSKTRT